jgi:diadenosine tetraphosphatase ApaH/serine/threonine PP2A family protein phosphatase
MMSRSAVALLSDVHANLVALEAVLKEVPAETAIWVMGDTVGYGPAPSEVMALLRERGARLVAGNHDLAVAGAIGVTEFNEWAAEAVLAHRSWLSVEERDVLAGLPRQLVADDFTLVHGSLRDPVWEYVLDSAAAQACLSLATTAHCCHGHTHMPGVFTLRDGRLRLVQPRDGERVELEGSRSLINPGSVGQPRDGDPRAAWALYDPTLGTVTFRRTSYRIDAAQRAIRARKLPGFLAERLAYGI